MAKPQRAGMGFWDRLVLLVAWMVTCGLVYLLGLYVGKGTQEQRLGLEERIVRLPVISQPPPEGQRPKTESDLTFYETLAAGEHREPYTTREAPPTVAAPSAGEKPPVAPVPAATPAAHPPPATPAAQPHAATPAPVPAVPTRGTPAPAVVPPHPAAAPVTAAQVHPVTTAVPAAPRAVARAVEVPVAIPAAAPPAPPQVGGVVHPVPAPAAHGGGWTVQANPTRSHDEAEAIHRRLRGHGYDANVVRVVRDGDTWYRVQVGRFATSEQATEVMQRLREHEGVSHAFVASE